MDTRTNSESLLDTLPKDIKQEELYLRSPLSVLGLLAQTSNQYETETAFLRLLSSAVNAEPESYTPESYLKDKARVTATPQSYQIPDKTRLAAIAILKRHPELLFKEGRVTDHFSRKIRATPYRLFLGAGDVWALKQVHEEIIAMIEDPEARAKAETQTKIEFQAQFPDYKGPWPLNPNMLEEALYDERNKAQIEQVKAQLKIVVAKITADPCPKSQAIKDETTKAVADLCNIFTPKEGEIIKTGLHFPLGILKEISQTYDEQYGLDLWNGNKLTYFFREVIGGAEVALTAVDGQCVKEGLVNINEDKRKGKGPNRRDGLFCRHPKGCPTDKAPFADKLGKTLFVDPYDGAFCFLSFASAIGYFDWCNKNGLQAKWDKKVGTRWWGGHAMLFGKLMENKSSYLWELLCSRTQRSQHTVAMDITK
ncbi:MAG: hypothetical protein KIT56_01740 [Gammaproteobacteria bacterium]|nr:hypothetical protein [Gammaproteobacteria bacterium]